MKILFICGSLESGRDGVGDYTQRLARESIHQGHQASIVALNDIHLVSVIEEIQYTESVSLPILRLPSFWSAKRRVGRAKRYTENYDPDWISLQFVPFSFHHKGLSSNLSGQLAMLGENFQWHIMFHELWVGMEKEASIKVICWGRIQRMLIQLLLKKLNPKIIHTQTELYQKQIERMGFQAQLMPLFSNIPLPLPTKKPKDSSDISIKNCEKIKFVLFGSIQVGAPIIDFASELAAFLKGTGTPVSVTFIGRNGPEMVHWKNVLISEGIEVEIIGEISPSEISDRLSSSTMGISTTPLPQIGKSGTVAAMREHGLAVLCVARPWNPRGFDFPYAPDGIIHYKKGELAACLEIEIGHYKTYSAADITMQFIDSLNSHVQIR